MSVGTVCYPGGSNEELPHFAFELQRPDRPIGDDERVVRVTASDLMAGTTVGIRTTRNGVRQLRDLCDMMLDEWERRIQPEEVPCGLPDGRDDDAPVPEHRPVGRGRR